MIKKIIYNIQYYSLLAILLSNQYTYSLTYSLPAGKNKLIGTNLTITIPKTNIYPLEFFAEKFQIGLSNLLEANPNIDIYLPKPETPLLIPHQLILPDTPRIGIIINSAEMRLYFYPKNSTEIIILPIGIGEVGSNTPFNWITSVYKKKYNPTWTPTKKIRQEYKERGETLPHTIPGGPNNPMGLYALYIGQCYAIHGTNAKFGIGLRVSHGCVRLRNHDIKYLFKNIPIGTRVQFINEPVKITYEENGSYYLEVHHPLSMTENELHSKQPINIKLSHSILNLLNNKKIDQNIVDLALKQRLGIPINITQKYY